jgi:hypothetical protein
MDPFKEHGRTALKSKAKSSNRPMFADNDNNGGAVELYKPGHHKQGSFRNHTLHDSSGSAAAPGSYTGRSRQSTARSGTVHLQRSGSHRMDTSQVPTARSTMDKHRERSASDFPPLIKATQDRTKHSDRIYDDYSPGNRDSYADTSVPDLSRLQISKQSRDKYGNSATSRSKYDGGRSGDSKSGGRTGNGFVDDYDPNATYD